MFKRIMASLGAGSAKVDLLLASDHCRVGEAITGKVMVEGGSVDQNINNIDFDLVMRFNIRGKEFTKIIDTIRVARNFTVRAKETQTLPFEYQLPFHCPVSKGSVSYYLETKMDIARATDTSDSDALVVLPGRDMSMIMEALDSFLGFREKTGSGKIGQYGQEFEYYPTHLFADQLKELELKFYIEDNNIKLFLELELTSGFLHHGTEHHTELAIPPYMLAEGSVEQVAGYIKEFLENELNYVAMQGTIAVPSYQNHHHHQQYGHGGFGGFMGGIATGLLGAVMLDSLFGGDENETDDAADADTGDGGLLDFDPGDLGDFGNDLF